MRGPRMRAWLGAGLVGAVLLAPASARAFEDASLTPESVAVLEAATDVLFDRGAAAYRQQAYARAAEMWERSYDLLGELPGVEARRDEVALHLAHAHLQANAVDHDPRRLVRARELLSGFTVALPQAPSPSELADRERAAQMLEIIGYRLDRSEAPLPDREVPPQPQVSERRPADSAAGLRRGNGLIAGGATGLALGVVALGVSADLQRRMAIDHADPLKETRGSLNAGRIAAITVGGTLLAAGTVTLVLGIVERQRAVRAAPMLARDTAGLALAGRF